MSVTAAKRRRNRKRSGGAARTVFEGLKGLDSRNYEKGVCKHVQEMLKAQTEFLEN